MQLDPSIKRPFKPICISVLGTWEISNLRRTTWTGTPSFMTEVKMSPPYYELIVGKIDAGFNNFGMRLAFIAWDLTAFCVSITAIHYSLRGDSLYRL